MNKLNELQVKSENISVKNEYSKAVMESIKESILDLSNKINDKQVNKEIVLFEIQGVVKRAEVMFNLLGELMSGSDDLNTEVINEIVRMKRSDV